MQQRIRWISKNENALGSALQTFSLLSHEKNARMVFFCLTMFSWTTKFYHHATITFSSNDMYSFIIRILNSKEVLNHVTTGVIVARRGRSHLLIWVKLKYRKRAGGLNLLTKFYGSAWEKKIHLLWPSVYICFNMMISYFSQIACHLTMKLHWLNILI